MANVTRKIGLSLGADICWPICYEEILRRLDLAIPMGTDTVRFAADRVTIEPFDLQQPCKYDVVIDRLTHWYHTSREWIKKSVAMDGLYVFNNPWSVQSNEKHTSYAAMMRLGFPVPQTWLLPPKRYEPLPDLQATLDRYAKLFDLGAIGKAVGYPMYMKPYDGGAWANVSRIENERELRAAYDQSGTRVMHLQKAVEPHDRFVRCIGLGPQTYCVLYDPSAPLHGRYTLEQNFISAAEEKTLRQMTLTINAFFGWDFNSCEALRQGKTWSPIDFANPCPDSQVTSLHYHFPWLIESNLRWSLFCAATQRKVRVNLDWTPFFEIAARDLPFADKLAAYARIAEERFETARFEEFCAKHLPHLRQVTWDFFATDQAFDAVRQKVTALYPAHEVDTFTTLFWNRIQHWREQVMPKPAPANGSDSKKQSVALTAAAKPAPKPEAQSPTPPPPSSSSKPATPESQAKPATSVPHAQPARVVPQVAVQATPPVKPAAPANTTAPARPAAPANTTAPAHPPAPTKTTSAAKPAAPAQRAAKPASVKPAVAKSAVTKPTSAKPSVPKSPAPAKARSPKPRPGGRAAGEA